MLMSSSEKLTVRKEIARTSSESGTSLLNSAPENFVVVQGQSFRVSRTSFDHSLVGGASKAERGRGEDVVLRESSNGLTNVVAKQTDELQRQALRIEELERFITSHSGSLPRAAVEAIMSSSSSSSSSTASSGSGSRLGLAARRRAESLSKSSTALETVTTAVGESSPPADSFHDCGSSSPMSLLTVTTAPSALAPESDFVTPTSDGGDISMASNTPGSAVIGSGGGATGKSPPPRGLAARLAMGSQERRRLAAARRGGGDSGGSSSSAATTSSAKSSAGGFSATQSPEEGEGEGEGGLGASPLDNENYDTALYGSSPVPPPPLDVTTWKWITRKGIGSSSPKAKQKLHLFVAHDNPQVGNTVATQLRTEQGMRLMIESKEDGALSRTCIILATIVYSGPSEGVEQAHTRGQRGSQFIVCTDLKGFRADIKAFPTRTRGDILEIDLHAIDASCKVDFDDDEDRLRAFIQACTSRVDVILDPSCSSDSWYPYWEGRRKMAPQFRSRGIGYLRLGDDMSRYGTAFLSLDAGKTFLDNGATSIVEGEALKSSASSAALTYSPALGLSPSLRIRAASAGAAHQHRGNSTSSSSSSSSSALRPHSSHPSVGLGDGTAGAGGAVADVQRARDMDELRDIVLFLRQGGGEGQQRWADRAERLGRLGQLVGCLSTSSASVATGSSHSSSGASPTASGMQLSEVISVLHETITRQSNPHVLRAAIGAVRCVGDCCNISMCGVAWRTLLLQTMHLLRATSKTVHDEAREALCMLHTRAKCLSLAHLQPMLEELLAGPRKGSASSSNASSSRVVAWLTGLCKVEVDRMSRQLATAHSDAFKPSPFEKADTAATLARCRGLLSHREEATRDAAVELCVSVVLLDVLWSSATVVALVSAAKQASSRLKKADSSGCAAAEAALLKGLSPACGAALSDVSKVAPRLYDKLVAAAIKGLSALANNVMTMHAAALAPSVAGVSPRASASTSTDRTASAPLVPPAPQPQAKARGPSPPTASASAPALPSTPVEPNPKRPVLGKGVSQGLGLPPRHPGIDLQADFTLADPEKTARLGTPDGTDGTASTASTASSADDASDSYSGRSLRASPRARSSPPEAQAQAHPLRAALEGQWFEAKLVLRMVPNTESSWNVLTTVLSESSEFVSALTAAAKQCGIPRGTLLRAVLPFDESTSSNDQSNVRVSGATINAPSVLGKLDASDLNSLRTRAVDLRRLLRVKMADEADLLQATAAAELLKRFCKNVEAVAADSGVSAVSVVKTLI